MKRSFWGKSVRTSGNRAKKHSETQSSVTSNLEILRCWSSTVNRKPHTLVLNAWKSEKKNNCLLWSSLYSPPRKSTSWHCWDLYISEGRKPPFNRLLLFPSTNAEVPLQVAGRAELWVPFLTSDDRCRPWQRWRHLLKHPKPMVHIVFHQEPQHETLGDEEFILNILRQNESSPVILHIRWSCEAKPPRNTAESCLRASSLCKDLHLEASKRCNCGLNRWCQAWCSLTESQTERKYSFNWGEPIFFVWGKVCIKNLPV